METINSHAADSVASPTNRRITFSPAHLVHYSCLCVMAGAICIALWPFISWAAIPVASCLAWTFSRLAATAIGMQETDESEHLTLTRRLAAGAGAALIGGASIGLSGSTLWEKISGLSSSITHQQAQGAKTLEAIQGVFFDAVSARAAVAEWSVASARKAAVESTTGGTCPSRPESRGKAGPITVWRREEAELAARLRDQMADYIKALEAASKAVPTDTPRDFAGGMAYMEKVNEAVKIAQGIAGGSQRKSAIDVLDRRIASKIRLNDGQEVSCEDQNRLEQLNAAKSALEAIGGKRAGVQVLTLPIDLRNAQEVAIRGLIRAYTLLLRVATFGRAGSFEDDPQMKSALEKSVINRETVPFILAAMIELAVISSAALASRSGRVPFPLDPQRVLSELRRRAKTAGPAKKTASAAAEGLFKLVVNLLGRVKDPLAQAEEVARAPGIEGGWRNELPEAPRFRPSVVFSEVVMKAGLSVWPFKFSYQGETYLAIPREDNESAMNALEMARVLVYQDLSILLNEQTRASRLRSIPEVRRRIECMERECDFEVYKLNEHLAHAIRVAMSNPANEESIYSGSANSPVREGLSLWEPYSKAAA